MQRHSRKRWVWIGAATALVFIVVTLTTNSKPPQPSNGPLKIVAAENFWGSLAEQLGGRKVQVMSVVSDPNADPHEYASSTKTARAVANADYVILNGAGYDGWGDKLLAAAPNAQRKSLHVAELLGKQNGDNPHFWYSPAYVNKVIVQMDADLIALEPSQKAYFESQLAALQRALMPYETQIVNLQRQFAGAKVAATEDVFTYLAEAAGLNLISPPAFTQAVGEGNDPPAASVVTFQQQLQSRQPRVLVYNLQTITPLTENMKKLATVRHIPIVGITETLQPPGATFQSWMSAQLVQLEQALQGGV